MNKLQILDYWAERFSGANEHEMAFNILSIENHSDDSCRKKFNLSESVRVNAKQYCEQKNVDFSTYYIAGAALSMAMLTGKNRVALMLHVSNCSVPIFLNIEKNQSFNAFVKYIDDTIGEASEFAMDFSSVVKFLDEDGVQYEEETYLHCYVDESPAKEYDNIQISTVAHSVVIESSSANNKKISIFSELYEYVLCAISESSTDYINSVNLYRLNQYRAIANNATGYHFELPSEVCLGEVFKKVSNDFENEAAIITDDVTVTYKELFTAVQNMAHTLISDGVRPNMRCAVLCKQNIDTIVIVTSLLYIGAVIVPLDKKYPPAKLKRSVDTIGIERVFASELISGIDNLVVMTADFDNCGEIMEPIQNEDMYITFTSGTTGTPKAIKITCKEFYNLHSWYTETLGLSIGARNILLTSFGFDATIKNMVSPLLTGASLVLTTDELYDIKHVIHSIEKSRVTHINCVPSLLNEILKYIESDDYKQLRSVLVIALGGEKFPNGIACKWSKSSNFNAKLVNVYGPAEGTDLSVYYVLDCEDINGNSTIPIGRPISNRQVFVFDEDMNLCTVGEKGELLISGIGVIEGYVDSRDNADKFIKHFGLPCSALYKTGDIVFWNDDGQLMYSGRSDNQIKYNGQRIEIEELETVIEKNPCVDRCMVKIIKESDKIDQLVAYYTLLPGQDQTPADLRQYCLKWINVSMIPSQFLRVEDIPLTANGKIDRSWNAPIPTFQDEEINCAASNTESKVLKIWEEVLSNKVRDIDTPFFEAGGNSLLLTRLQQEIEEAFDIEISVLDLMELATVRGISEFIDEEEDE